MNTIRTKFLLVIAGFSIAISVFLIMRNCTSNIDRLQAQVDRQTALVLEFDLAIREYVAESIRPFAAQHISEDEFLPETMSTSYVSRSVFEKVRRRFPDYIIKFSSDDPRNPVNRANATELEVIKQFNQNPAMQRWSGEIEVGQEKYYGLFSARRMQQSCLRCHGDPVDAPASLIQQYGDKAGFHRPIGEVIALDTVAIPIEKYNAMIWQHSIVDSCFIVLGLGCLFGGVLWIFNRLVSKRLSAISSYFRQAADQQDLSKIHLIETDSSDEIGMMEKSFNFLASTLKDTYNSLEQLVDEKTSVLQDINHDLQAEVQARIETEKALKTVQQKMLLHFEQTPLGVIEWDLDFRVTSWNPAAEAVFGYSREEAMGRTAAELILPKGPIPRVERVCADLLEGKGGTRCTNENICKNGRIIFCEWYNTPLVDDDGRVIAVASLVQDITFEKEHEKQLEKAKLQAEAANQAKSEFLANMSHEIRTPMNSIIGFSDLLSEEELTDDQWNYVDTIRSSSANLLHIINDILDYSKIEAGDMKIELVECSLNTIIHEVSVLMDLPAKEKGLAFNVCRQGNITDAIVTDPVRLKQCLINLIGNAIKFTEDGYVMMRVRSESIDGCRYLEFGVEDTGVGVEAAKLSHIFESFKQADGSTTRKFGGTGLGLTITQKLVSLLGGTIAVESTPGKGSNFMLKIPVSPDSCEPVLDETELFAP
ncbi:MAG: c-type heme family protein [Planctomycetota bacterium]|jgi:PAS domain S-box-containing protein